MIDTEVQAKYLEWARTDGRNADSFNYRDWLEGMTRDPEPGWSDEALDAQAEFLAFYHAMGDEFHEVFEPVWMAARAEFDREDEQRYKERQRAKKAAEKAEAKGKTRRARARKDSDKRPVKRRIWPYAPVPRAIIRDDRLSPFAKLVAVAIADMINPGLWNTDLHVDSSQRELARRIGISASVVGPALAQLQAFGILDVKPMKGRGGTRFTFRLDALSISTDSAPADGTQGTDIVPLQAVAS